ncbi:citrate lyase acyl carrier protein [Dickeya dadantii]|uniref:citrate lyase acyl carrier protein n=1 Tax=Dickeya dadantii TaxID=204038 RepID=UPI0003A27317|nr:citrate lyase acyl carrier protein [Dickeya dadantii]
MKIIKEALAGTFESSDLLVRVAPAEGPLTVVINSEVIKQFGAQITQVVNDTLAHAGRWSPAPSWSRTRARLDCVIRARLQSAVLRAAGVEDIDWETL